MDKKRAKRTKNALKILASNGFHKPFQIVVDSAFVERISSVGNSFKQIIKLVGHTPKLLITECEYKKRKKNKREDLSGQCEIMKCSQDCEDADCLLNWVLRSKNKHHYIIGTGEQERYEKLRKDQNTPQLKIIKGSIRIELNGMAERKVVKSRGGADTKEIARLEKIFADKGEISE